MSRAPGRWGLACGLLLLPGAAQAWPAHQLFVEAGACWTFGGTGHFGLTAGAHYSLLLVQPLGPDVGPFVDVRWSRLRALAATAGARVGGMGAYVGGGGYEPFAGANAELGWTLRTNGPSGLRVGGGASFFVGQVRVDGLVWTPKADGSPAAGPDGALPLASWGGSGTGDLTLSLGAQVGVLPRYYLLADTPPPDTPGTVTVE